MTRLTSRVLSFVSNSGLSTVAWPTSASTAVPPRAGFGTVATGWHATSARTAANAAAADLRMRRHPDVGDRADEEAHDEDPRGPVDLPLEAAPRAVAAAQAGVPAANRAAEARGLRRLNQHPRSETHGEDRPRDAERVLKPIHRTRRFYLAAR